MTVVHRQDVALLERLGGSDADVHRAIVRTTGRVVVAKHTSWDRPLVSDRLDRAASILQRVQDPGLARIVAQMDDDHGRCLLLAHEPGGSLAHLITSGRTFTPGDVAAIGGRVAGALAALHGAGIVHRDVHPGNVLLDANLAGVLIDLDNALDETSPPLPGDRETVGHPDHVDHRVMAGGAADPSSDLHGLATTLWTALTGITPPRDGSDGRVTLPLDVEVPESLRDVLTACLDRTISNAETVATGLLAIAEHLGPAGVEPDHDAPPWKPTRGHGAVAPGPTTSPGDRRTPQTDGAHHTRRWGVPTPETAVAPATPTVTPRRGTALPRRFVVGVAAVAALLALSVAAVSTGRWAPASPPPQCDAGETPLGQRVLADLDGDGCAEALGLLDGELSTPDGRFLVGRAGDVLVAGDWDGDGRWGIGLYRPATGDVFLIDDPGPGATSRPATPHAVSGTPVVVEGRDGHEVRIDTT